MEGYIYTKHFSISQDCCTPLPTGSLTTVSILSQIMFIGVAVCILDPPFFLMPSRGEVFSFLIPRHVMQV